MVSNAIKYTQRGFVQLRCLRDQAFVRVEVLDSGIGMPPSALVHIYHLANQETGIQVIEAMRRQVAPDLKATLMTGDTSSAMRMIQHDNKLRAASKPIKADELLGLLRELLAD